MNPFPNALRSCALFADIDPDDLDKMLTCLNARFISADKGEYLMTEGAPAQYIGLLLSGRAQVVRTDYFGNRSIAVSIEPGELFAESFACAAVESLPVSVEACEKCTALLLDCRRIMNSCCNVCAFHSRLMKEAGERFAADLAKAELAMPAVPVYHNYTADAAKDLDELRADLARQISGSVRWEACLRRAVAAGADTVIEFGPGAVLTGLARRTLPELKLVNINGAPSLDNLG